MYTFKTPFLLPKLYPSLEWSIPAADKVIYLTFDDGPHPEITRWVMKQLETYNAKATFFCIGNNVSKYPEVINELSDKGHKIGNHTNTHLNGWKTSTKDYIKDIESCNNAFNSKLFRPPYGKITASQIHKVRKNYRIVMWSILTGDFDTTLDKEKSLKALKEKSEAGSIIVFHDSEKAKENLEYLLPPFLKHFTNKGYRFETL